MRVWIAIVLCAIATSAEAAPGAAADVVTVFSLPLGGKLDRTLPKCSFSGKPERDHCGLSATLRPPTKETAARISFLHNSVPVWADTDPANLTFDSHGNLAEVKVKVKTDLLQDARKSIAARFGPPTRESVERSLVAYYWDLPALHISLASSQGYSVAEFISAATAADRKKRFLAAPKPPLTP